VTPGILGRIKAAIGLTGSEAADGRPRVSPDSVDGLAATLGLANEQGWKVRIEGARTWMPADLPADLAVSTERLSRILSVAPSDLVAAVQGGATRRAVAERLGADRTWVAIDPPGSPDRTLGSILATGTAGAVRHRFGPLRDQVLGTTVVTGDGRVVRAGGVVVKNVAGFDLSKLQIGGFGAFGVIAEANLRLRALPPARRTLLAIGELDPLANAARALVEAGIDAVTVELVSAAPAGSSAWWLLLEIAGTEEGVLAEAERARQIGADLAWEVLSGPAATAFQSAIANAALEGPVTIRLGVLPQSIPEVADLVVERLGPGRQSASAGRGGLRWTGHPLREALIALRRQLATREIPVTVERAPWSFRAATGHFGGYREGVRPLSGRVRAVFDPSGLLVAPLEGPGDA
jgi:FAD/FMN-containing dehydrogenase